MAINYPTTLDSAIMIGTGTYQDDSTGLDALTVINNLSAIEIALENSVGINGSLITSSLRYITGGVVLGDKAASLTGTETLTNKTLSSPVIMNPSTTGTDAGAVIFLNKNLTDPSNQVSINGPESFGTNYQIVTSIVSNALVVTLKNINGSALSATSPAIIRVFNTQRTINSPLSITIPAGVNYLSAGIAEFIGQDQDLFVYYGFSTTVGAQSLLISRIPYAIFYGDFNVNNLNEKGAYISIASFSANDRVELIGRINATNSGTASYTWSIPATSIVINRPIYLTRYLNYISQVVGWASPSTQSNYQLINNQLYLNVTINGVSNATNATFTTPFFSNSGQTLDISCRVQDNSIYLAPPGFIEIYNSYVCNVYKDFSGASFATSGAKTVRSTNILINIS